MRPQSLKKRTSAPSPVFPTPNCVCWTSSADLHAGHRGTEGFSSWFWNERGFYEGRGKPSISFRVVHMFSVWLKFWAWHCFSRSRVVVPSAGSLRASVCPRGPGQAHPAEMPTGTAQHKMARPEATENLCAS